MESIVNHEGHEGTWRNANWENRLGRRRPAIGRNGLNADFSIQSTYPPDKNNQFPRFYRAQ